MEKTRMVKAIGKIHKRKPPCKFSKVKGLSPCPSSVATALFTASISSLKNLIMRPPSLKLEIHLDFETTKACTDT